VNAARGRARRRGGGLRWTRLLAIALGGVVAAAGVVVGGVAGARAAADDRPARRVLVLSLPYVSWADIERADTPHLDRFVERAAVAGLSTRVDARMTPLGDGYATIGAGTRTVSIEAATGGGLGVDEPFGAPTAGDAFTQRTGLAPRAPIVQTAIVGLVDENAGLHYDGEVGALADALAAAGIGRAVVANADGEEPDAARSILDDAAPPARQRLATLGLMDHDGRVAGGRVDPGLLAPDAAAPFGVRLDRRAVTDAFADAWSDRTVTLVEASDLVRVARYAPYVTDAQHAHQVDAALADADALLGELLGAVDLTRDVVMVVGPAHAPDRVTLTPLAIRGPGFSPGLLRSATTRRDGFVQIQDIAPTVLDALGVPVPDSMEGQAAEVGGTGGSARDRLELLRREDAAAQFRDAQIGIVYVGLVAMTLVVVLLGFRALRRPPRGGTAATFAALLAISLLAAAFLVRVGPLHEAGRVGFFAAFVGIGVVLALGCAWLGRRRPLDGLLAALLVVVALLTVDAMRGAPLVLNSTLGYSPTVAGRFAGFGNPAYAAYAAAALCAAVLLAHRLGGRRGRAAAGALLGLAVVVDVAPMWGSDVGGILSMVPAYLVTMAVLTGRRIRARTVAAAGAVVVAVGAVAALADLARPADERTHLGRLVADAGEEGVGAFTAVVQRKLALSLATIGTNLLGLVLLIAVVGGYLLWRRHRDRVVAVLAAVPEWRAACLGFVVLAALGFALNDSGMTVPGIMLVVFVAAWVHLLVTTARTQVSGAPGVAADDASGDPSAAVAAPDSTPDPVGTAR